MPKLLCVTTYHTRFKDPTMSQNKHKIPIKLKPKVTVSTGEGNEDPVQKVSIGLKPKPSMKKKLSIGLRSPTDPYTITLPHGDSWVRVYPTIPDGIKVCEKTYEQLWNLHPEEYGEGVIFGKVTKFPRWQQSYGQGYSFTGMMHEALPVEDPYMVKLLNWVQEDSGLPYKQVLINWYQDGNHYIGPHSDDEKQLVPQSAIYSFSYGQKRDFVIKSKDGSYRKVISMPNNSLIIMGGEMQKYYKHSVPKRALSTCPKSRINITFRLFE
jgi:alkylated DNA repair dioxygenase AlkB